MRPDSPLVLMIHGVSSTGDWYRDLKAVLWPLFRCKAVRYRTYHCLGPLKVFFWPWALLLAAVLIAFGMAAPTPDLGTLRLAFPWLLMSVGVFEMFASRGVTRGIPWFLAGGWALVCLADLFDPEYVLFWSLVFTALWIGWSEAAWTGNLLMFLPPVAVAALPAVLWVLSVSNATFAMFAVLVVLIAALEIRENPPTHQLTSMWRAGIMIGAPCIALFGWWLVELNATISGLALALGFLVFGAWEPPVRVSRTLELIRAEFGRHRKKLGRPANLVAHSLGTFMSGRSLETHPFRWVRIVFVGGVISHEYDWARYMSDDDDLSRIQDVRNESGGLDLVVRAIGWAGGWARKHRLGTAGLTGLRPPLPTVVHDVADAYQVCVACPPRTRLHNYAFSGYFHSTYFLSDRAHMRELWLPFFLGYPAGEYHRFLDLCTLGAGLIQQKRRADVRRVVKKLRLRSWHWAPGGLDDEVRQNLGAHLSRLDNAYPHRKTRPSEIVLALVPGFLCQIVTNAIDLQDADDFSEAAIPQVEALEPPIAIVAASQMALTEVQKLLRKP